MSSPANAPTAEARRSTRRPRCPCRPRPAAAARRAMRVAQLGEPVPRGEVVRDLEHLVAPRSGAVPPVQRDADAGLALDEPRRRRRRRPRRPRLRRPRRGTATTRGSTPRSPSTQQLHARTARRAPDPATGTASREEVDRPAAHDPDPPDRADEPREHVDRRRAAARASSGRRRSARAIRRSRRGAPSRRGRSPSTSIIASTSSTVRRYRVWTPKSAARATIVGRTTRTLVGLSHRSPRAPRAEVRGGRSRARGPPALLADAGLTVDTGHLRPRRPRSRAGSAPARCTSRSARSTTRCPASVTRAGTTSSPRPRSAPGLALAPLVDDLGLTRHRHRHAGRGRRRRQGATCSNAARSTACTRR